ncbi:Cytochrome c, class I precursor [hydrothermal vent metagenome]|uniref:Cytochrome c, class I n=1 Tax=hydrothermal vent metagenome TaxID=652676 RepID=A0A1W1C368_9ZZZZ
MKKTVLVTAGLLLSTLALSANNSGEEIFKAKCSACHLLQAPGAMYKPGTPEFRQAMNDLKAPPMAKVASMIKMKYETKEAFAKFVNDYITTPDASKTVCMKNAVKGFGLMPAIGKTMSTEEKKTVAEWIYNNAKATPMMKKMKCGAGKCGGK